MPTTKISLNIETTSQPKQYHSIKDLKEQIMYIENKHQKILNDAKNLAIEKKLYTGKIETLYDEELNTEVSIKNGDQKTEENQEYIDSSDDLDLEEVDPEIDDLDLDF